MNGGLPPVVLTGAGGWLGQNLVRAVAADREHVRCLVRSETEATLLSLVAPSVEPVLADVRDPVATRTLFDGLSSPTVVHAAAVIHPNGRTREFYDVNVGGTQNMLDAARAGGAGRFVHVSSNSPFGANPTPDDSFTEDSPFNPYMAYGVSKLEGERLVTRSWTRGDLETVILRPPWFYGPFQPARQTQWLRAVRRGRFPLVGNGTNRRSMVFTGNLVQAVLRAETAPKAPGRAYWVADREAYAMRDVLDRVRDAFAAEGFSIVSRRPRLPRTAGVVAERVDRVLQAAGRYQQALHVLGELKDSIVCDVSLARDELGYAPDTDLLAGMRTSIRWCVERGVAL